MTGYLRWTVMISYWFWQLRLTITDYAVSFPFAVGPWAGRNSSIDMGSIEVGRRVTQEVPPGVFWRSLLHLGLPQFLKFNISLGKDALFGVYIRKGLPPSHAQVHAPECRFHICLTHPNNFRLLISILNTLAKIHFLKKPFPCQGESKNQFDVHYNSCLKKLI